MDLIGLCTEKTQTGGISATPPAVALQSTECWRGTDGFVSSPSWTRSTSMGFRVRTCPSVPLLAKFPQVLGNAVRLRSTLGRLLYQMPGCRGVALSASSSRVQPLPPDQYLGPPPLFPRCGALAPLLDPHQSRLRDGHQGCQSSLGRGGVNESMLKWENTRPRINPRSRHSVTGISDRRLRVKHVSKMMSI